MNKWLALAVLAVLVAGATSCTNDALDDGSGPDVILEVLSLENPAITGQLNQQTGECDLTITDWNATLMAAPKNTAATTPFNDVALIDVTIVYAWVNGAITTPTRTIGLGNTTIPAMSSSSVTFQPITLDDITPAVIGATANLTLTFRARTVEGTTITDSVQRALNITCTSGN